MSKEKQVRVIEVVPYNFKWNEDYQIEAKKLSGIMDSEIVDIHHIGSTSIPKIYAKPVIDILIEVKDINNIDKYNEEIEKLGYIAKGEYGIKNRRFFMKELYNRTHHIHTFETGNPEVKRHLNFRDYMIAHPAEAKNYEKLKKELAKKFRYDNERYCEGKDSYIKDIDKKAEEWFNKKLDKNTIL